MDEERCLPAKTRRSSDSGMCVRRARSERRLPTEVDSGMVMGKAVRTSTAELPYLHGRDMGKMTLTVACHILDENLHRCLGLCG